MFSVLRKKWEMVLQVFKSPKRIYEVIFIRPTTWKLSQKNKFLSTIREHFLITLVSS